MFDLEKLADVVNIAVKQFAAAHVDETFYAFAIDAKMLCLNSQESFAETLVKYQTDWPGSYTDQNEIDDLKYNTGDWKYQGFFDLRDEHGFDSNAYNDHYYEAGASSDGTAQNSKYAIAMNALIERIKKSNPFLSLRCTKEFRISWVDHNY